MDLESVMCELAGTSNTSIVPLLSLEKEQFMCQVSHFCKQGQRQRHNDKDRDKDTTRKDKIQKVKQPCEGALHVSGQW